MKINSQPVFSQIIQQFDSTTQQATESELEALFDQTFENFAGVRDEPKKSLVRDKEKPDSQQPKTYLATIFADGQEKNIDSVEECFGALLNDFERLNLPNKLRAVPARNADLGVTVNGILLKFTDPKKLEKQRVRMNQSFSD